MLFNLASTLGGFTNSSPSVGLYANKRARFFFGFGSVTTSVLVSSVYSSGASSGLINSSCFFVDSTIRNFILTL